LENRVGINTPAPPSVTQGTPLQAAIASTYLRLRPQGESLSLMKLFLGKGALPHPERPVKSALERSISLSITSMLRALLAARARTLRDHRVDVNYSSKKYRYALHAVVEHAEFDVLWFLLVKGGQYRTVFQAAATCQGPFRRNMLVVFQTLVGRGAGINQVGGKFGSTLQAESFYCPKDAVGCFTERGADPRTSGGSVAMLYK